LFVGCKYAVGASYKTRAVKLGSIAISRRGATDIKSNRRIYCMSEQDLKAELERLQAENEALKNRSSKATGCGPIASWWHDALPLYANDH
jgi:hypothetical protein